VLRFLYYVFDSPFRAYSLRPFLRFIPAGLSSQLSPHIRTRPIFPLHLRTDPTQTSRPIVLRDILSCASERYVGACASRAGGSHLGRGWGFFAFDGCVPQRVSACPIWGILGRLALPLSDYHFQRARRRLAIADQRSPPPLSITWPKATMILAGAETLPHPFSFFLFSRLLQLFCLSLFFRPFRVDIGNDVDARLASSSPETT